MQATPSVCPPSPVHRARHRDDLSRIPTRWLGGRNLLQSASQGMLECQARPGRTPPPFSPRAAAQLEELWSRGRRSERERATDADIERVLSLAASVGVCSFAQALEAARAFLLSDGGGLLHRVASEAAGARVRMDAIAGVTFEAESEGPTATVLRTQVLLSGQEPVTLALLVARDLGTAAARLSAQASDLRVWHRAAPRRAARVLEEGSGRVRWFGQVRELAVVASAWVPGRALGRGAAGLEWRDEGGPLQDELRVALARKIAETRSALATFAADGACERTFHADQGEVLVTAAQELVLVGSAARSWWGPLGAWPYRLAAAVGAASEPLLAEVVLAGLAVVRERREGRELLSAMLHQAGEESLPARALAGLVRAEDRDAITAMVRGVLPSARVRLA
ncbi:MAG: hypothetical protein R3B48_25790 [Kofleriaceae bacterium]